MPPPVLAVQLPFLYELAGMFAASVVIAYACYRLRLAPIAGFLIAGVLIGPDALGLVRDRELVDQLAEVGIILLLFTIGMEFSLERLSRLARAVFVAGGLQVVLTIGAVTALIPVLGASWTDGIYTGCLVSLSSTVVVLSLLAERNETSSPAGGMSLAILIFQDLAVVVMVLLVPMLGGEAVTATEVSLALGKAAALIAVVLVLARRVVPWLLERAALTRRQDLFLLTVMAVCLGIVALTQLAGVSLALGAFLAGLVVSESRYSDHALSEVLPLRTIFQAVFFVSIGMLLDLGFVVRHPLLIVAGAALVVAIKFAAGLGSVLALGYPVRVAATTGLALAQVGEFAFVLERAGRDTGLEPMGLSAYGEQEFVAVAVALLLATPLLVHAGPRLGALLDRFTAPKTPPPETSPAPPEDHTIIVGYGPAGRRLVQVLRDTGLGFCVIEMNPVAVREMEEAGIPVIYGDAGSRHILEHAGAERAKLLVAAVNDPAAVPRIIGQARFLNPTLEIIARTRFLRDVENLQNLGADVVVPEEMETTVRLFTHVLGSYQVPPDEIEQQVRSIRADDYRVVRGSIQEAHLMVLQGLDEDGLHTRAVAVRERAPAAGQTLEALALRRRYGLTVLAVRRDGRTTASPAGDFRLEPGDRLVLVGTADRFAACAGLFRSAPPPDEAPPA